MSAAPNNTENDYWEEFEVIKTDLEFINNHLFELESPQTSEQIIRSLVEARIETEKAKLAKQKLERGRVYLPKEFI